MLPSLRRLELVCDSGGPFCGQLALAPRGLAVDPA